MNITSNSLFMRIVAGVGISMLAAACTTADTAPPATASQSAQTVEKNTEKSTITGSRLPAKQTERMVTGTDGRDLERSNPVLNLGEIWT